MVANQRDVKEVAKAGAQLARAVERLVIIVSELELRIAVLEEKARDAS